MNRVWCILIVASLIFGFFNGELSSINHVLVGVGQETLEFAIPLLMATCFWNGVLNVARNAGILTKMEKILHPFLSWLLPDLREQKETLQYISANIIINMFGLGFAATPSGLKAMKLMQEKNSKKDTATRSMVTFLVLNTAGVTLLSTNIVALRNQAGALHPTDFLPFAIIATSCASFAGLTLDRILNYGKNK